ncbi:MAG: hypothetical protein MMC23_004119 [Stictis urceolatum]|nr:hypothetical protein [Stictis urceolata]
MAHPPPSYSPQYSTSPTFPPHTHQSPPPQQYSTAPPPTKRAKLSPNPPSPYGPPSFMGNGLAPNPNFAQNPYQGHPSPHQNGFQSQPHTNAPPTPTGTMMGPPSRPVEEKPADLNDLSDVLYSAGIDVRSEEAALVQRNYNQQHDPRSFETAAGSFNSVGSLQHPYFDNSPYLSQNTVGDRASFYGAGSFNQPALTPEAVEQQVERARKEAIRNKCYAMQYELRDPFLYSRPIYKKLVSHMRKNQIKFPDGRAIHATELNGPNYQIGMQRLPAPEPGNVGEYLTMISAVGTSAVLPSNGAIADIATLLSLAAKERIRAMIEDSAALARGRRISSHGVVPPDFRDLATGTGEPTEITSAVSPNTTSLKRTFSEANSLPTPVSSTQDSPRKTISFRNALAVAITKTIESDNALEEARAAKRSKRNVDTIMSGEPSRAGSISSTPAPGTPGAPGERAPDVPKKGLSKKEQKRQADAKASEAQQHAATSSSLNMALGTTGNLFGGKKISWMSSKKPAVDTGFGPPRIPPSSQKATSAAAAKTAQGKKLGEFREDREGGQGIQLRDMIMIMEPEPKERRALARAYNRMGPKR